MAIVELQNVKYSILTQSQREFTILKDINLQVNSGEFHIITGPSGSGKTTLLQIISTILHQSSGVRILFSNKIDTESPKDDLYAIRSKIGYLLQAPYLPLTLKVREIIELQCSLSGVGCLTAEKRAMDLLTKLEIDQFSENLPSKLSGGEKQRVALATILAQNVDLLLLDEPTGSLDYENSLILWDLIKKMTDSKITVIAVTHDKEISESADFSHMLDYGIIKQL